MANDNDGAKTRILFTNSRECLQQFGGVGCLNLHCDLLWKEDISQPLYLRSDCQTITGEFG